jgi:peptide/nickel transport system permease protein
MISYLTSRLAQMLPVVFFISVMVFALTMLLPGDPTLAILGEYATPEQRAQARVELGLDQPIPVQYARWVGRLAEGDLGRSLRTREPVLGMLAARLPVTIELAILSCLVAVAVGIPLGVVAALRHNTATDATVSAASLISLAIPNFWAGILLIYLFSLWLGLLPPSGFVALVDDPATHFKLMIMPCLALGTSLAALVMRQTRASMLEVLSADYIRTAVSKGLTRRRILVGHALRNSLIPLATIVGLQFGHLLGGAVIVETIFGLPGLGRMLVEGIFTRDAPTVQGAVVFVVLAVLVVNLLTDLLYAVIDPRIDLVGKRP